MGAPHHWTEEAGELERLGHLADAIELAGCVDLGDAVERCDGGGADLWSVYFHFPAPPGPDPDALRGVLCIADRDTIKEARAYGQELAARFALPVHDFT